MAEVWAPAAFDVFTTGHTLTAAEANALNNSLRFLKQPGVQTFSADVPVTATTVGTANQIVALSAFTYEAVPHLLEFFCPRMDAGANAGFLILRDSTTVIGTLSNYAASAIITPFYVPYYFIPTAASHTYNVASWNAAAATANYRAGTGGVAGDATTRLNGFIRITRVPT